jgi:protein-disulfide isomerase
MFKTLAATLVAGLALAACSPQGAGTSSGGGAVTVMEGDSFLGDPNAKVTVVEYGAPTCPGCTSWHNTNWAQLKKDYIDTNKIKFIFREFPSHNPPVDAAIFSMARCSGQKNYFPMLDEAFAKRDEIEKQVIEGKTQEALNALGSKFGLSAGQVQSCIKDKRNLERIFAVREMGDKDGVQFTPTFLVNGKIAQDSSFSGLKAQIDSLRGAAPAAPAAPAPAPAQQ